MEKVFTVRADYEDFYFNETFYFKVFSSEESARKALKEQIQRVKKQKF